jgi:hypothetical protein
MYAIDISAARRAPPISRQEARGEFKDAVTLVTQAQAQFGAEVAEWTAEGLRKRLYGGKVGMSFTNVTKRPNDREQLDDHFSEERQRLGDSAWETSMEQIGAERFWSEVYRPKDPISSQLRENRNSNKFKRE